MYDTLSEYFDDLCPQVLSIGVTYDEFWHGDPEIVDFTIRANEVIQKNGAILNDVQAWNTGRYVMLAVGTVLSQAFSRNSQAKYPQQPILAAKLDAELAEQQRERELIQQRDAFLAVAAALNMRNSIGEST